MYIVRCSIFYLMADGFWTPFRSRAALFPSEDEALTAAQKTQPYLGDDAEGRCRVAPPATIEKR